MDPLSVSVSIIGILTAAQQTSSYIGVIVSKAKKAPGEILELKATIDVTPSVLSQLQAILLGQAMTDSNTPIILALKWAILDRVRWGAKTDEVRECLQKLEMQKNSLALILTILTCESTFEAKSAVGRLEDLVTRVLESHQTIAQHMLTPGNLSTFTSTTVEDRSASASDESGDTIVRVFEFQKDLESSRAYSRSRWRNNDTFPVGTGTDIKANWSIMSGLSLSDISNIGVLALPIAVDEISNGHLYVPTEDSGPSTVSPTQSYSSGSETRHITFIASTEYHIADWNIKV